MVPSTSVSFSTFVRQQVHRGSRLARKRMIHVAPVRAQGPFYLACRLQHSFSPPLWMPLARSIVVIGLSKPEQTRCSRRLQAFHRAARFTCTSLTKSERGHNRRWNKESRGTVRQGHEQHQHRRYETGPLHGAHATELIFGAQPPRKKSGWGIAQAVRERENLFIQECFAEGANYQTNVYNIRATVVSMYIFLSSMIVQAPICITRHTCAIKSTLSLIHI